MMQSEKHPETGGKLKQMNPGVFQMNDMTTMDDGVGGITDWNYLWTQGFELNTHSLGGLGRWRE